MKNIYNKDGIDRSDRNFSSNFEISLLEADFSSLFSKAMMIAEKKQLTLTDGRVLSLADLYRYQPFVVYSEIASFKIAEMESLIHLVSDNPFADIGLRNKIVEFFICIEDWRIRLEWIHLKSDVSYSLLGDITEQIRVTFSSYFQELILICPSLKFPKMGSIWYSARINAVSLPEERDFLFRLGYQLVAFIKSIQTKKEIYRDEILSDGNMDSSLAMMVSFLTEYGNVVSSFNKRLLNIPDFYYGKILGTNCRPEKKGKFWISVNKTFNFSPFTIAAHTVLSARRNGENLPCRLLSDLHVGNSNIEDIFSLEIKKSKVRHPEADLNYVTSFSLNNIYPNKQNSDDKLGIAFRSSILRLSGGHRYIELYCSLTQDSFSAFKYMLLRVSVCQSIGIREAANKVLNESTFRIFLSTASGFVETDKFLFDFDEKNADCNDAVKLIIDLDTTFPPVVPVSINEEPELRILISKSAWLFPYSWCRKVKMQSLRINVKVEDSKNFQIYNDLGQVDITQPFNPFGSNAEKGSWFAVGSNEMAHKKVSKIKLSMSWRGLPKDKDGLSGYYDVYNNSDLNKIDNTSFKVQSECLRGYEWKPVGDLQYMFRTGDLDAAPEPDVLLSDKTSFCLSVSDPIENNLDDEDFVFGEVPNGFYRFVFSSPEMGFGMSKYRSLFAEKMMLSSRAKIQIPLPQQPIQPMIDSVGLSYEAQDKMEFVSGGVSDIKVSYLQPMQGFFGECIDLTMPVPIVNGMEEGVRLVLSFSNALGVNVLDFYLDMESLMVEVDDLPIVSWYYQDCTCWQPIKNFNVLSDETNGLLQSGHVSLLLPEAVTENMLDEKENFWISALVVKNFEKCAAVRSVYTNSAQVELLNVDAVPSLVPGVEDILAVSQVKGNFDAEDENAYRVRIKERISHRNRALLAEDYEMLVLQNFPEIDRVKCIPHVDTKNKNRSGIVTIVLMRRKRVDELVPLFTDAELREVEVFLKKYVSPFVEIDAINPEYEEVTLFCGIKFRPEVSSGEVIGVVENNMKLCIAPWLDGSVSPVLGRSFSVMDLRSAIRTIPQISAILGLKIIQVVHSGKENEYERKIYEWKMCGYEDFTVSPSSEWTILKPADVNYVISLQNESDWHENVGIGDFEVGETFVIEQPSSKDCETMDC